MNPLQTLLDERKATIIGMVRAHDIGIEAEERFASEEEKTFLQGVRLGLAMGRECVPVEDEYYFDGEQGPNEREENAQAYETMGEAEAGGFNEARSQTFAALEAKEKELGV